MATYYLQFERFIGWILFTLQMLLMKRGGQTIYMGPLGQRSHKLVEYFEVNIDFQNMP